MRAPQTQKIIFCQKYQGNISKHVRGTTQAQLFTSRAVGDKFYIFANIGHFFSQRETAIYFLFFAKVQT